MEDARFYVGGRFVWCREPESNRRPRLFQSRALPTELSRRASARLSSTLGGGLLALRDLAFRPLNRDADGVERDARTPGEFRDRGDVTGGVRREHVERSGYALQLEVRDEYVPGQIEGEALRKDDPGRGAGEHAGRRLVAVGVRSVDGDAVALLVGDIDVPGGIQRD